MKKIKIGVLGTASIAKRSIIPAIKSLDENFILVGIASRSKAKADEAANQFNTQPFYDYNSLINAELIDALYIPLPNAFHFEYALKALEAGIHVLVEKSVGCNLAEVEALVAMAREKECLLMENFQFRFHDQLNFLKSTIASGVVGDLRAVTSAFCFPPFPDSDNIRYQKDLGGGALLDAGAYTTKISTILLGNDLIVKSGTLNHNETHEVDIWGSAYLVDPDTGVSSSCIFGFDHYYQCGVQIIGTKGKITTNRLFTARDSFSPTFEVEVNGEEKRTIKLKPDDHFNNMLMHFYHAVFDANIRKKEYLQNLVQAKLLQDVKTKAHEE